MNLKVILLFCALGLASGAVLAQSNKQKGATKLSVSGQVFVVTKGKENIKLALVDVNVIPEQALMEHLEKRRIAVLEEAKSLGTLRDAARNESDNAKVAASDAAERIGTTRESVDYAIRLNNESGAKLAAFYRIQTRYTKLTGPGPYFEGLPTATARTKTDADGKFVLTLPAGRYVLAAASNRTVYKDVEEYFWLVKIDPTDPSQVIMLSNDNLVETKCKDCIAIPDASAK